MESIRRHLESCPECAADVEWARQLRQQVLAEDLRHLAPERIVALAGDRAAATAEELGHLAICRQCQVEIDWANRQEPVDRMVSEIEPRIPIDIVRPQPRSRLGWHWGWAVAAGVAVAAIALIMITPTGHRPPPLPPANVPAPAPVSVASLARLQPLPVRFTRAPVAPGGFEDHRMRGLEAYESGDYAGAAVSFRRALAEHEDDETRIYLGSAELLRGNARAADSVLAPVASQATDTALQAEALWQIVNARLLLERRSDALDALVRLRALESPHRIEADSLVRRLEKP
jgi:hypothetical protein